MLFAEFQKMGDIKICDKRFFLPPGSILFDKKTAICLLYPVSYLKQKN
jgi:hypothetical protein